MEIDAIDRAIQTGSSNNNRILGLDVARAVAIMGMAFIHFAMVLSGEDPTANFIVDFLGGRPAAIFMILAGIGVSLSVGRKTDQQSQRVRFIRRGVFFLLFGFVNLVIWPGDILRVYGIAYLVAASIAWSSNRSLLTWSLAVFAGFTACVFLIDFETNWDFNTLTYANLWTISGGLLNLFYNGFRAVFPWVGMFLIGMLIGRQDLRSRQVQRYLFWSGIAVWITTELLSFGLLSVTLPLVSPADGEDIVAILGTKSLPPMPFFLLAAGGFAVAFIFGCVQLVGDKDSWSALIRPGQMAFTWYILHIVLVIAAGAITGFGGKASVGLPVAVTSGFCLVMCLSSWMYLQRFRYGPLEFVLRKTT